MKEKNIKLFEHIIEFSLCFLIFCLPFAKAAIQVFSWFAIFAWLIKKTANNKLKSSISVVSEELNIFLLLFVLACTFSMVTSIDIGLSSKALFGKVIKNALLYLIIVEAINNKHRLRRILAIIIASAILILADAAIQYFRGMDFLRSFTRDTTGLQASFSNRNSFGGWLIVIIPICLGIIASRNFFLGRFKKIGMVGLFILLLICLGLSFSRASWIGSLVSLGFIVFYGISFLNKRFKILATTIIILFSLTLFFILPPAIKARIDSITRIENSSLFRINLWKESFEIIEDFPLFGVGLNTYTKAGLKYAKAGGGYYPHNSYLHMAAEIGTIGLLCFLWFIVRLFKKGLRVLKKSKDPLLLGLLGATSAFLVQSFFDVNFYALQLATLFWFILGLTVARINILLDAKSALA